MNFDDLIDELPNGLHDAQLHEITIAYSSRTVLLHATAVVTEEAAAHRDLKITLAGVAFFLIDPPDPSYPFAQTKPLWIDAGSGQPATSEASVPALPPGTTLNWIYVNEWNAFIRFAAASCRYEWIGEKRPLEES
jgi:hypothetical protein